MAPKRKVKAIETTDNDIEVHSPEKIIDRRPSIDQCEAESEADMLPALQKKGSAKKNDKKKIPATQNTPTTKAQPFKKKKTIDLASPSGKDTSANLAPLPDESTSPDKPVPHESGDSKGSRSKNYDDEEDVHICKSWLHVSQDPLNSTNQAGDTFWKRVGEHYESMRDDTSKFRTWTSVKSRWQILQHAVNKFCGAIEQVKLSNQSGVNAEDQFNNALKYYKATSDKNKKFSHLQCYYVLHEAPKWKEHRVEWLKKQRDEKKNGEKSGSTINSSIMDSGTIESLASDPNNDDASSETSSFKKNATVRPSIGTRKAKDLVAKAREDKKFKEDIISVHRDLAQKTKKQNNILSVQQEALTTLADHAIMSADLVTASEHSRRFYEWSQMKVLEKIKKERAEYEKKKKIEEEEEANKVDQQKKQSEHNKSGRKKSRGKKAIDYVESDEEEEEGEEGEEGEEEEEGDKEEEEEEC
ncbi:hypothetical protein PSHT_04931 [Puccinia striiformis]|uniref:No apical meristem-associated C-terminal domain-containing protein n=1 Tax=Puccinia striiformis TaxID=27350 RepID=A0A2S4WBM9_9BASI|nr:hypothetical protein PSHT_04931 [Puccinia striiformis]